MTAATLVADALGMLRLRVAATAITLLLAGCLFYEGEGHYLHIWQTHVSPEELGENDPVPMGQPIAGTRWNANPLRVAEGGRAGIVEFSSRLDDGRTVTIDSDLDRTAMQRILDSLVLRSDG